MVWSKTNLYGKGVSTDKKILLDECEKKFKTINHFDEVTLTYEVFSPSELASGSKIALFSPNLRYQTLTQRWNADRT